MSDRTIVIMLVMKIFFVQFFSGEELPHVQGAVAAWVQEGREELLHIQGQEGWPWYTPHPR